MTGRRAIIGLCMLCALAISAIAAQGASAESKGTTVFTCKPGVSSDDGAGSFKDAHCKEAGTGFGHKTVAPETTTELTGTTIDTEGKPITSKLKSVQAGVNEELQSKLAHILLEHNGGKSWITNAVDPKTGEHYFHGEAWVQYTEVEVTAPAGKGCVVKGGQVTTEKLKFTSKGQEMFVLFEPASGTLFAEFEIEGCSKESLNGPYKVEGSLKAEANGATLLTTHANVTTQGTLKLRGFNAGFESTTTIEATDEKAGDKSDTPLSVTTVSTP